MKSTQPQKILGGIGANAFMRPIIAILAVLDIAIIAMFLQINTWSGQLASAMSNVGVYTGEANSLLAGTSLLSQTAVNFVLVPVRQNGSVNTVPLKVFVQELGRPRRGRDVLEHFRGYDVSEKARAHLAAAAQSADKLLDTQLYAIALVCSVYPLPDEAPLNKLSLPALKEADKALADSEKLEQAKDVFLGTYSDMDMFSVSQNINACVQEIRTDANAKAAAAGKRVAILRTGLWIATISITLILIVTFMVLYKQMINPLTGFVQLIASNQFLDEKDGMQEVRQVASAYNNLEKRREALRSVAETDSLTNLPNRYRFEKYMLDAGESGYSLAILMFDINYLKETNDTLGHSAGDELIQKVAHCIASCFGENSFRIGGDEFVAVIKNCERETIQQMIKRFEEAASKEKVSVSLGYSYTEEIGDTPLQEMLDEADKQMYVQKQEAHKNIDQFFLRTV